MNITLINPRLRAWSPNVLVPLGLLYIASVLEHNGHEVQIIDMNAEKVSDSELIKRTDKSAIVGITGMITEYNQVVMLTKVLRSCGNTIILGGPLASTFPQELLEASGADYIVVGEGERAILEAISLPSNRIIKHTPIQDLDAIPFPAWHLIDLKRYVKNQFHNFKSKEDIRTMSMITSRGCPYSCTFCYKDMWGKKWRGRSADSILKEMVHLYYGRGINGFIFNDDTFVMDKKRVLGLCYKIIMYRLNFNWLCNGRVDLMDKGLCETMASAGCREIAFGIESGNQTMLDSIKKGITLEQIRNAVRWSKEAGIRVNGYFMLGLPNETKAQIEQTIRFAEELDLNFYGFSLVTPLPGTELYKQTRNTKLLNDWSFDINSNLTADCNDDDLVNYKNEVFKRFTLKDFGKHYIFSPAFIKKAVKVVFSLQSIGEVKDVIKKAKGIIK